MGFLPMQSRKMSDKTIDILLIEDNHLDAISVRKFLAKAGGDEFLVNHVESLAQARDRLETSRFDVVLLDLYLPDSEGIESFKALEQMVQDTPIVILTGDDEGSGVSAVRLGAQDYLNKQYLDPHSLSRAVRYAKERHALYRQLESRERMIRQILEQNADGLLIVASNGLTRYINPAGSKLLGTSANGLIDRPFGHVLKPGKSKEMQLRRHDGGVVDVEVSVVRTDWEGEPALLATLRDMTTRKEAEAKWLASERRNQQSQKLESLGMLSGGISHGLNNLLTAILANASMLKTDADQDSPAYNILQQIEAAATEAGDTCIALLNYTGGVRPVEIVRTRVNEMIESHRRMLEFSLDERVKLEFEPGGSLPEIDGDPTLLSQVLMNLVANASDARRDEPPVVRIRTFLAQLTSADVIRAHWPQEVDEGEYVCLEVEDNGCGMPEETLSKVYDPFFSTRFAGRGMGMAVVMGIVRAHNGMIAIDSKLGRGTRVRVYLPPVPLVGLAPFLPGAEATARSHRNGAVKMGKGRQMLVVDDEEMIRRMNTKTLENLGYRVTQAGSGSEAIDWFRDHHDDCSAVLLDYLMPGRTGEHVLSKMLRLKPEIPVILTSGHARESEVSSLLEHRNVTFLPKPFGVDELKIALAGLNGHG